jgi:O-antigen/teichoic acid export membrane protein
LSILEQDIKQRAIKGGFWVFTLRIADQTLALIRLVILARLLSPNDFGLMGIAVVTMGTVDTFSQTGFEIALIQRKRDTERYLDTAWTVGILRSVAIFATLYLIAPLASRFFNSPGSLNLIRAIGAALLFRGFANIGAVYFRKELEFNKQFIYIFSGRVADFTVAVAAAFTLRNAWVLVLAFLASDAVKLVVSYIMHPYRPRLRLDRAEAAELFGFGKWILGSGVITFLLMQGDKAFVGRFVGSTMLGFYQIAYRISNLPATEIAHVISRVTVPAYSKVQDSVARLREGYLKVVQVTAFASVPIAGVVFFLAHDITTVLLGEKWLPAVTAMRALALWGAIRSLTSTTEPVFVSVGKPRLLTKYMFLQISLLAALIYPFSNRWGILGTSVAVAAAGLISSWFFFNGARVITECRSRRLASLILVPVAAAAVGGIPALALRPVRPLAGLVAIDLVLVVAIYALTYLAATWLLGKLVGYDVRPVVREIIQALKIRKPPDRFK